MSGWWHRDVIAAGKLPLMLCLLAFVVTFVTTRTITRMIRAGRGPFRDRITSSGVHVHHAVPGLILLVAGAFMSVASTGAPWIDIAAVLIGMGASLVLDEFALILHLSDDYWSAEGRLSVDVISLAAACLGLAALGFSPVGVDDVGGTELAVRVGGTVLLAAHAIGILVSVLKGKYSVALIGVFVPLVAIIGAVRIARPGSVWARHRYSTRRQAKAVRRADSFDRRWQPLLRRWQQVVGGLPESFDTTARPRADRAS